MPTASFNSCRDLTWRPPPPEANPFATRYVRPGAHPYLFPPDVTAASLVARWNENGRRGQITGPHGSGKSTLLHTLTPLLQEAGWQIASYTLHPGQRRLRSAGLRPAAWDLRTLVMIDGYEQLSWWSRTRVRRRCMARGAGLLVTAHRPLGLPELWRTEVSPDLTREVVSRLVAGRGLALPDEDIGQTFATCGGNLREVLFALYDQWERLSRQS